jgi:hypothetical protein
MEESRTKPFLLTCIDENGTERDFIVKLHSQLNGGILGEFWCAQLGHILQLPLPTTAIVEIDPRLGVLNPDLQDALQLEGPHFGSELIGQGLTPYDGTYNLPNGHLDVALEIFAFDCLVQNPDRRKINPNLFFNQNRFWMIDHELALRFEGVIGGNTIPRGNQMFVEHVLYMKLKRRVVAENLTAFIDKLSTITNPMIHQIAGSVPQSWNYPKHNSLIVEYLLRVMADLVSFRRCILEVLA